MQKLIPLLLPYSNSKSVPLCHKYLVNHWLCHRERKFDLLLKMTVSNHSCAYSCHYWILFYSVLTWLVLLFFVCGPVYHACWIPVELCCIIKGAYLVWWLSLSSREEINFCLKRGCYGATLLHVTFICRVQLLYTAFLSCDPQINSVLKGNSFSMEINLLTLRLTMETCNAEIKPRLHFIIWM